MSNRTQVETAIFQFFEALKLDDASEVPLTEHVKYFGMLSSEPVRGEADVRDHIQQIAPFMLNESHGMMIIEGSAAAVLAEFDTVNDIHSEGAFFFEVEEGKISMVRAIFDTRAMFTGR